MFTGLAWIYCQLSGCAPNISASQRFENLFLVHCRNERGPEQWHSLESYPDLLSQREFLVRQIRDFSNGYCQVSAFSLYSKVSSPADASAILKSVALQMDGQDVSATTQNITDNNIRNELRFFLSEKHPSKWPLLDQLVQAKNRNDSKTFERCKAIAKKRIKNGDFSAADVLSLERRF